MCWAIPPCGHRLCSAASDRRGNLSLLAVLVHDIADQVNKYGSLAKFPADAVGNTRNDMYLASEAIRNLMKDKESELGDEERHAQCLPRLARQRDQIHPDLGEDRGRDRARLGHHDRVEAHRGHRGREDRQDTSDLCPGRLCGDHRGRHDRGRRRYGLPVSTTHVLSSGIAGTMAANGSGLQLSTFGTSRSPGC